jgi:ubiquinone/menaquinone biosynthesis C-methylase UbiE
MTKQPKQFTLEQYHLAELHIALNPKDPRRIVPVMPVNCRSVLEVGCGAGQTLIACGALEQALACGLDFDYAALQLGKQWSAQIHFVQGRGESLPFRSEQFDFVVARLSLPYMNIPVALAEIARVLKPGGKVWVALHPFSMVRRELWKSMRRLHLKGFIFQAYVIFNGLSMHLLGKLFLYPSRSRRCESFQTTRAMRRALHSAGLVGEEIVRDTFFVATAEKGSFAGRP